jgi:iron complex outermembrane recepter protein
MAKDEGVMRKIWLPAVFIVTSPLALIGTKSWAQAQGQSSSASTAAADIGSKGSSTDDLGEVVVTAQRRSERDQDVPIAITAITPKQIRDQGIVNMQDVQLVTPGLTFTTVQTILQPYIRGVGSSVVHPGTESAVAIYNDGAYQTRSLGQLTDLFDMSGVEVLNGAQGTLYGRNATGGVILYNTADPEIGKFSARALGEYGDYDHAVGELVVNAPLGDTLALRLGAREYTQDGYVTNIVDGGKLGGMSQQQVRGKLKWQPTDRFSAVGSFTYVMKRDHTLFYQERLPAPYCNSCGLPVPGANLNPVSGFYEAANDPQAATRYTFIGTGILHLHYSGDLLDVNSVTSMDRDDTHGPVNGAMVSFTRVGVYTTERGRTLGEELQASTKLGACLMAWPAIRSTMTMRNPCGVCMVQCLAHLRIWSRTMTSSRNPILALPNFT